MVQSSTSALKTALGTDKGANVKGTKVYWARDIPIHLTGRWMHGKVRTRCDERVEHALATMEVGDVTCERCLRGMCRDRIRTTHPPREVVAAMSGHPAPQPTKGNA